jgi:hypothetical protein
MARTRLLALSLAAVYFTPTLIGSIQTSDSLAVSSEAATAKGVITVLKRIGAMIVEFGVAVATEKKSQPPSAPEVAIRKSSTVYALQGADWARLTKARHCAIINAGECAPCKIDNPESDVCKTTGEKPIRVKCEKGECVAMLFEPLKPPVVSHSQPEQGDYAACLSSARSRFSSFIVKRIPTLENTFGGTNDYMLPSTPTPKAFALCIDRQSSPDKLQVNAGHGFASGRSSSDPDVVASLAVRYCSQSSNAQRQTCSCEIVHADGKVVFPAGWLEENCGR